MTIKRRLFISNALMIVLPLMLVVVSSFAVFLAFVGFTDFHIKDNRHNTVSITSESQVPYYANGNYERIPEALDVYYSPTEGYLLAAPDSLDIPTNTNPRSTNRGPWIVLGFLIVFVLVVNSLLTRYVYRSIMDPIEILSTGVQEIRDGNLEYRIDYQRNDEFAPVCDNFNDMGTQLSEMVEQRQRDERSRQELIAGISHDLRTPLTSIKAYLEGLRKGVASSPEKKERYLRIIEEKTKNLEYIINQLFVFTKFNTGEFPINCEPIDIVEELQDISEHANDEYGDSISVSYHGIQEPLFCNIDSVQFQNVIHNILSNSIKYKDKEMIHSEISCTVTKNAATILVSDNGPGVSPESIEKLFDIFYREDTSRQKSDNGSGIGLAISQKITERFGGTIHAENNKDQGLTVRITLPLMKGH